MKKKNIIFFMSFIIIVLFNIYYNTKINASISNKEEYKKISDIEPIKLNFNTDKEFKSKYDYSNIKLNYMYRDKLLLNTRTYKNIELPNIKAKLISDKNIDVEENQEIKIKYEIQPESFYFNQGNTNMKSDVVFVIDVSKDMGNYIDPLKNDIWNDILNNQNLKNAKTEYDVITFSNKIENIIDSSSSKYSDYNNYINDLNNDIKNKLNLSESNSKDLKVTYNEIIKLMDSGRSDARKNVIFIAQNSNILYGTENDYAELKEKGYNIITVELQNFNNNNNNKNDLINFHKALNGTDDNYFYCKDQNDLQNYILQNVSNSINSNKIYNYVFNPTLQIDLGENFDVVSGIENLNNNIGIIKVPHITYKYSQTNNMYNANKFNIEFTVKVKQGKTGILNFGTENKLIYKKLVGNEDKYSSVETPIITVKNKIKDLTHGIYNGVINNKLNIEESDGGALVFAGGSTLTMGSTFITSLNNISFDLIIDNKFNLVDSKEFKVYKVNYNNESESVESLKEISYTIVNSENNGNRFSINLNNFNSDNSNTKILLVYRATIKDESNNEELKNNIEFTGDLNKEFYIKTSYNKENSPQLPDLF